MKFRIIAAAAAVTLLATPALAQDGGYVQVNLGGVVSGDLDMDVEIGPDSFAGGADLESGLFASIAGGGATGGGFSLEAELIYLNSDIDTADADAALGYDLDASVESYAALINVNYNFGGSGSFAPYVGAGVGYGQSDYELDGQSADDKGLAWQLKAGVVVPLGGTTLDFGYRYVSLPRFDVAGGGDSVTVEGEAHVLSVGARFAF